jgi:hypothetical protein
VPAHRPYYPYYSCISSLTYLLHTSTLPCRDARAHGISVAVNDVSTTAQTPPSVLVSLTFTCSPPPGKDPNAGLAVCDALSALPDGTDCFSTKLYKQGKLGLLSQNWGFTSCSVGVSETDCVHVMIRHAHLAQQTQLLHDSGSTEHETEHPCCQHLALI